MNDDFIKAAYRQHTASGRNLAARSQCPSPEQMAELAGRGGGSPALAEVDLARLDHVLACRHCQPEFELLRSIAAAGASQSGAVQSSVRPTRRWFGIAAAAALVLAVGVAGERWRRSSSAPTFRAGDSVSGGAAPSLAAADVTPLSPLATVSADDSVRFIWHHVDGSVLYAIDLVDSTGALLASRTTGDTTLVIRASTDAELLATLRVAQRFDWMVVARRGDGNERRSPVVRVQIDQ